MKTLREEIARQKRLAEKLQLAALGFFLLGFAPRVLLGFVDRAGLDWIVMLSFVGFMLCILGSFFVLYGIRCPGCGGRIGYVLNAQGHFFGVSKKLRYCPYCGADMDSPIILLERKPPAGPRGT